MGPKSSPIPSDEYHPQNLVHGIGENPSSTDCDCPCRADTPKERSNEVAGKVIGSRVRHVAFAGVVSDYANRLTSSLSGLGCNRNYGGVRDPQPWGCGTPNPSQKIQKSKKFNKCSCGGIIRGSSWDSFGSVFSGSILTYNSVVFGEIGSGSR